MLCIRLYPREITAVSRTVDQKTGKKKGWMDYQFHSSSSSSADFAG